VYFYVYILLIDYIGQLTANVHWA